MLPLPPDDVLHQLIRFATDNWYYIAIGLIGLLGDKRGTIKGLVKNMASISAQARVETGEHKTTNGSNGNGVISRSLVLNVEMLVDKVAAMEQVNREVRAENIRDLASVRKDFLDFQQTVLATVGAANAYTDHTVKSLRAEFDMRFTQELASFTKEMTAFRRVLEERLPIQ